MSAPNFWELHAREKINAGGDWLMISWEALPHSGGKPAQVYVVTGAVPDGTYASGKRKGKPRFGARDQVYITPAEHKAWLLAWEASTGLCHQCDAGREWIGWSADEGRKTKECSRCGGTGKQPVGERAV